MDRQSSLRDLQVLIDEARRREDNDDHLTDAERQTLVDAYRALYPTDGLSDEITEAFISIVF